MELEALQLHCMGLRRTADEEKIWVRQWAQDFEGYPRDLIAEACRQWRNHPHKGEVRFPVAGQLKALVDPMLEHRRRLARRAALTAEALGLNPVQSVA